MALSILDGNQSATTLSTILTSGQHITAHTVVSLGTQAITDMRGAVSGSVVSISNFPASQIISGTVTANPTGTQTIAGTVTVGNSVTIGSALDALNDYAFNYNQAWPIVYANTHGGDPLPISGTITIGSALPAGTNRIGVVTIGGGTVTIGAGTAQIGSVTVGNSVTISSLPAISGTVTANLPIGVFNGNIASDEGGSEPVYGVQLGYFDAVTDGFVFVKPSQPLPISGTVTVGNSVTIGSCVTHGVTITNTVVTFYPLQGTTVTNSNFTSTTASTTLVSAVAGRKVLTVFNEGAGNLHISPGATCTTVAYQVRLSAGDYWECPNGQLSLAHTAVFSTAGTARVTEVS